MKLKDYFEDISNQKLDDVDKMDIYEKFLLKKENKSLTKRLYFYIKVGVFTIFFVFILYIIYPTFFVTEDLTKKKVSLEQITTGLYVNKSNQSLVPNQVFAKNVGKILELRGKVYLLNGNVKKEITDSLVMGKDIFLSSNSNLKFSVGTGIYIEIIGPAKFIIEELGQINGENIYVINLIEGDYIKVKSESKSSSNVVVKVDDLEIDNKDVSNINFELNLKGNKKLINNKGDQLIIKKQTNNKKVVKLIPSEKKVEITSSQIVKRQKQQNNLKDKVVYTGDYEIDSLSVKIVPNDKQLRSLNNLIYKSFLKKNISDLLYSYIENNNHKIFVSKQNLVQKILDIYHKFDINIPSEVIVVKFKKKKQLTLDEIYFLIDNLILNLKKDYYIPKNHIKKLKLLQAWLYFMGYNLDNIKNNEKLQSKKLNEILDYFGLKNKYKQIMLDF